MQNDPLYNRIMEQMPDTEEIEGEITTLSGKVTALENNGLIFNLIVVDFPDGDPVVTTSSLTPSDYADPTNHIYTVIQTFDEEVRETYSDIILSYLISDSVVELYPDSERSNIFLIGNIATNTWVVSD